MGSCKHKRKAPVGRISVSMNYDICHYAEHLGTPVFSLNISEGIGAVSIDHIKGKMHLKA